MDAPRYQGMTVTQGATHSVTDIAKLDNNPDAIMKLIAQTLHSVPAQPNAPWSQRVVLGCWAANYVTLAQKYLPGYPISHIGFSTSYARQFFDTPNISFNMLCPILQAPGGSKFIKDVQALHRPIFSWTVNDEARMEWCIRRRLDGVITDDPKLFAEVCQRHDESKPEPRMTFMLMFEAFKMWLFVLVLGTAYRNRFNKLSAQSRTIQS